jgi:hypothetical protein
VECNFKEIHDYITDVMSLNPLDRIRLWEALVKDDDETGYEDFVHRFWQMAEVEQSVILQRFVPIVTAVAQSIATARARGYSDKYAREGKAARCG